MQMTLTMRQMHAVYLLVLAGLARADLLIPGIVTSTVELAPDQVQYLGVPQSALNQTEVEIRLSCLQDAKMDFKVQFVLRSTPCDKEFFDKRRTNRVQELLEFYFNEADKIPSGYEYDKILYYKSQQRSYSCVQHRGEILVLEADKPEPMQVHNVTASDVMRQRRSVYPGLSNGTVDGGASLSLSTWHPVQKIPVDGIYFLVLRLQMDKVDAFSQQPHNVSVTVTWRGPHGYLSAIDYPMLRFYGVMCFFYGIISFFWLAVCLRYYTDLLRLQFWIGAVALIGMVEMSVYYAEYANMNSTGHSVEGLIEAAELISCAKRTMSRVLVLIVSLGYGVVKPRLGSTMSQIAGVGFVYFVFCSIEGLARVSKNHVEAARQKQFAVLPLAILEMVMFWWIFNSLVSTMRVLKLRRNEVKLTVYRHFTNTLCIALVASVVYMIWSMATHIYPNCLQDWKQLWVDVAFWPVLFTGILIVVMVLFRPSNNNQRYAFTPLLDDSEDENEDDELFNQSQAAGFEMLVQRSTSSAVSDRKVRGAAAEEDKKLKEDLKWIDAHIPTSIAEHLLLDDDAIDEEGKEARELEESKML